MAGTGLSFTFPVETAGRYAIITGTYTITMGEDILYELEKEGWDRGIIKRYIPHAEVNDGTVKEIKPGWFGRIWDPETRYNSRKYPGLKKYRYVRTLPKQKYYKFTYPGEPDADRYIPKEVVNTDPEFLELKDHISQYVPQMRGGSRRRKHRGTKKARHSKKKSPNHRKTPRRR